MSGKRIAFQSSFAWLIRSRDEDTKFQNTCRGVAKDRATESSRPGARSDTLTTYIRRVENLERIGLSFKGVEKAFAVQAGRELRIMVQPQEVSDEEAYQLARQISRKIEEELQYPGQIRVTVLRETRCIEFAK